MTDQERREGARKLYNDFKGRMNEKQDAQAFVRSLLLNIYGVADVDGYVQFERPVIVDGNQKYIDAYIPATRVMIEMKSGEKDLSKKELQAGGALLTPYEQAKRYANNLPLDEMPRYIIACNFREFWIYDQNKPGTDPEIIRLDDLQNQYHRMEFLVEQKKVSISQEMQLSIKAGELVGKIHDRFLTQYNDPLAKHTQRSLNILCVRLVFCLYAEDAGLFGARDAFHRYIDQYEPKDIRRALIDLFQVLDTPIDQRADLYLDDTLAAFPYVNGGLFADENIVIPRITQEIKDTLLESSLFDWANISPTIFGAVFESTLNPVTRRAGGMHYTSIENIHKVIDPLFLDELRAELATIADIAVPATQKRRLDAFQEKLAVLKFLDPACGSGNFLTETYLSLRRIENEVIRMRIAADRKIITGQIIFSFEDASPIKVSISQFYGIEINDFAVAVARTALWIAESQMLQETEDIVHTQIEFLPLKSYVNIVEGNALRMDWNKVIDKNELNYIMGNPPFVGGMYMSQQQKAEIRDIYQGVHGAGEFDYVCGWYKIAAEMINGLQIKAAFVSTNSICQGGSVITFWKYIFQNFLIHIDYAYTTFIWDSEASQKAHVHCVIVGLSSVHNAERRLYTDDTYIACKNISPYLIDAPNYFIESRPTPLCKVPPMKFGSMPRDGGNFVLSEEEKAELETKEPLSIQWIRPYIGAAEFLNNKKRYCLWLVGANPAEINRCPTVKARIEAVRDFRAASKAAATRKYAETPTVFCQIAQPASDYILVPETSSGRRRYLPLGFQPPNVIASNLVFLVPDATIYHFGVLTSNVHNSWMRLVAGRLKSDYRYSKDIVYNNFPWPSPTEEQKRTIEQTAQGILDARALYPDASLADLYDPLTMPPELRLAHGRNDAAVMRAYGFSVKDTSEADCVAALMKMYQELTTE